MRKIFLIIGTIIGIYFFFSGLLNPGSYDGGIYIVGGVLIIVVAIGLYPPSRKL
ncbi:hypothetical protein [Parasphaerochaeta coccoides]|uniref:Uncharacterized protein n=1 Tax=Parasphaerochaeta coccoides (strain ATCC BAA-1237 / DSM 17374 / SPN1) TaxID=760011 RepID=F4GK07_PARC1|nr:hypothetical protein [Parasphaerochaeta coccoides]AEC01779.1 hypothetical protein Spico_0551 [Parasphaerochaeta coccoides DSM 17374]